LLLTGDSDRPPVRVTVPQAFLHAGAEAAVAALAAHHARERDGLGQHVDVAAQTAAMMATQSMILNHGWGDREAVRVAGGINLGPFHFRFVYPCKDGSVSVTFLFGSVAGPFTRRLMEWMCEEGFVDEATRDKDWPGFAAALLSGAEPISELERCTAALERFTLAHTKAELLEGALRRQLLIVPVSTTADIVASEQLAARDYWTAVEHPERGATFTYPGPFAKFSATPLRYRHRPPLVGEHNAEVYAELGLGERELAALAGLSAI
jgi:crotonobetainyl-CoA:carnitine CoA-transferase CaiB-like acyl-CoA transferase